MLHDRIIQDVEIRNGKIQSTVGLCLQKPHIQSTCARCALLVTTLIICLLRASNHFRSSFAQVISTNAPRIRYNRTIQRESVDRQNNACLSLTSAESLSCADGRMPSRPPRPPNSWLEQIARHAHSSYSRIEFYPILAESLQRRGWKVWPPVVQLAMFVL